MFRFCDERGLPLATWRTCAPPSPTSGPGEADLKAIGGISTATAGVLLRQVSRLEAEGGDAFFGEPEMEIADLIRTAPDGRGSSSVLDLADMGELPALFSTFLMWVLALGRLPRGGRAHRPPDPFEGRGRLLHHPAPDLPDEVLAQLGHRVQHAVRAFTPKDARALKQAVETFPATEHYDLAETLQALGVGEAAVTALDPRGVPTPVAATRLYPPASGMEPLTPEERAAAIAGVAAAAALRRPHRPRERRRAVGGPHGRRRGEGRGGPRAGEARPPGGGPRRRPRRRASPVRFRTWWTRASAAPWCAR